MKTNNCLTSTSTSLSRNISQTLELPISNRIPFGQEFVISTTDVAYLTHTIHKYPSKFIPQIPQWAIRKYLHNSSNSYVFDPMCGSGTTLLEAFLHGHNSIGIDIDPLATLISKVKVTPLNINKLEKITLDIKRKLARRKKGKFMPITKNLEHWFNKKAINDLSMIRDVIEEYATYKDIYDFLIVVFSSIIRKVSNADNQSQKTYVSHTNPKTCPEVIPLFLYRLAKYSERIKILSDMKIKNKAFIFNEDTRLSHVLIEKQFGRSMDLAITSPPYIKAIDYIYTNMAEYFWIGDLFSLQDRDAQNLYKRNYIGTKMIYSSEYNNDIVLDVKMVDILSEKISKKNKKFSYITTKFFQDILTNLKSTMKTLKPNSHYIMVVGDCSVAGVPVPVHKIIAELAAMTGFKIDNMFSYVIRNRYMRFPRLGRGGLITHDWIIDLKTP